jgi:hypothetical protein
MFRLYRKSEFDLQKALPTLKQTLAFRIKYRDELTWSPIVPMVSQSSSSAIRNRTISTASRTSAQSPRSSPDIPSLPNENNTNHGGHNSMDVSQMMEMDSLIQLYPPSSKDLNNRPLIVASIRYLDFHADSSSSRAVPAPKTQALAAFERLRRYLARKAENTDSGIIPLQFILIIDLAGGRVSSTVRAFDMTST